MIWLIVALLLVLVSVAKTEKRGNVALRDRLAKRALPLANGGKPGKPAPMPRRGAEIFDHAGGPTGWDEYIGQSKAKAILRMRIAGANALGIRLDHVLIASGFPGIGKSALARIIAAELGAGIVEVQGDLDIDDAFSLFRNMKDEDILVIDEGHKLMDNGKRGVEWLLPVLQDGVLIDNEGIHKIPDVTIIVATTDKDILPETILSRLPIVPPIEAYSTVDATEIAAGMAAKVFSEELGGVPGIDTLTAIARACSETPRLIAGMLPTIRDAELAGMIERVEGELDITPILEILDVTADGLDAVAQNILLALLANGGTAGAANLAANLNEPTVPRHAEKQLMGKGYMVIQPSGRTLTDEGRKRAGMLAGKFGSDEGHTVLS